MIIRTIPANVSPPESAEAYIFCRRCGCEIYSGEPAVDWNGVICPDCMREKMRRMTDCQLAQLLDVPYFIIK